MVSSRQRRLVLRPQPDSLARDPRPRDERVSLASAARYTVTTMGVLVGEIRAALGVLTTLFGLRRRRTLFLERRQQLHEVLLEALSNLDGIRRVWREEHSRFDWRAWLHSELLSTQRWHEHKPALTTRIDGGPVLTAELVAEIDGLYREFDQAARGSHAFAPNWEGRLVDAANRLSDELTRYSRKLRHRVAGLGAVRPEPVEIDSRIRTPQTPGELQLRALRRI